LPGQHLIIRTSVVFGWSPGTRNFAMQLWRTLSAGETMRVANDQFSTPTFSPFLADATMRLLEVGTRGLLNVAGKDWVSRVELALGVASAFRLDTRLIEGAATSQLPQVVPRAMRVGLKTTLMEQELARDAMPLRAALVLLRRQWEEQERAGQKSSCLS
jgi:dTDP-4-dehydrorhamnose reductase